MALKNEYIIEFKSKGVKKATTEIDKLDKSNKKLTKSTKKNLVPAFKAAKVAAAALAGVIIAAGVKAIKTASQFESLQTRLNTMYGSVIKGTKAFQAFNRIAATTPFQLAQVVEAGASLKAFGLEAEKTIKPVADLAAFMGVDIVDAAAAMGRAFSGGAGAADMLRDRGVLNLIKEMKGLEDLSKLTLPEFRKALLEALQDPAIGIAGSTDALAQTFEGNFSNMMDSIDRLADKIGKKLLPAANSVVDAISYMAGITDDTTDPYEEQLKALDKQSMIMAVYVDRLQNTAEGSAEWQRQLKIINRDYPEFIRNQRLDLLDKEKIVELNQEWIDQIQLKREMITIDQKLAYHQKKRQELIEDNEASLMDFATGIEEVDDVVNKMTKTIVDNMKTYGTMEDVSLQRRTKTILEDFGPAIQLLQDAFMKKLDSTEILEWQEENARIMQAHGEDFVDYLGNSFEGLTSILADGEVDVNEFMQGTQVLVSKYYAEYLKAIGSADRILKDDPGGMSQYKFINRRKKEIAGFVNWLKGLLGTFADYSPEQEAFLSELDKIDDWIVYYENQMDEVQATIDAKNRDLKLSLLPEVDESIMNLDFDDEEITGAVDRMVATLRKSLTKAKEQLEDAKLDQVLKVGLTGDDDEDQIIMRERQQFINNLTKQIEELQGKLEKFQYQNIEWTTKSSMSVAEIAKKFKMTEEEVEKLNEGLVKLKSGKKVIEKDVTIKVKVKRGDSDDEIDDLLDPSLTILGMLGFNADDELNLPTVSINIDDFEESVRDTMTKAVESLRGGLEAQLERLEETLQGEMFLTKIFATNEDREEFIADLEIQIEHIKKILKIIPDTIEDEGEDLVDKWRDFLDRMITSTGTFAQITKGILGDLLDSNSEVWKAIIEGGGILIQQDGKNKMSQLKAEKHMTYARAAAGAIDIWTTKGWDAWSVAKKVILTSLLYGKTAQSIQRIDQSMAEVRAEQNKTQTTFAAQYGMDEIVSQRTQIVAGEAGAERVTVTPMGQEPDQDKIIVNVSGNVLTKDFVRDNLAEELRESIRQGRRWN